MHLVVPFAAPLAEAGRRTLESLELPVLASLLARLTPAGRDDGDEWSLSPPHERVLARALGLVGDDGRLPWAARLAARDGIATGDLAWGLLTPLHWHLGTDQVSVIDPAALHLDEAGSRALFAAVEPLFTSEGFVLVWGAPTRWYLAHESLAALATASLDRVIGRNVDRWLVPGQRAQEVQPEAGAAAAAARRIARLQNEVQMLLHAHPLNEARAVRGELPVNSFWLSGCGVAADAMRETDPPAVDERLRAPSLAGDWPGWASAWDALDAGPLARLAARRERGEPVRLTLCGERSAAGFASDAARGWWRQLGARWRHANPRALLETL